MTADIQACNLRTQSASLHFEIRTRIFILKILSSPMLAHPCARFFQNFVCELPKTSNQKCIRALFDSYENFRSENSLPAHVRTSVCEFFFTFFHNYCRNFRTENPSMDFQIRTRIFILKILSFPMFAHPCARFFSKFCLRTAENM